MNVEMIETNAIQEYSPVEAGLQELRRKYANVAVDVTTTKALEEAKRVRAEIREPRYECEKIRKALKAPALAHAKLIDTEAARITAELLAIETPWDDAIKAEELRKEAEKEAKAAAERARITAIHERISQIRGFHALSLECRTSERVQVLLDRLVSTWLEFDHEADFAEFCEEAQATYDNTHVAVISVFNQKLAVETENARIKADQQAAADKLKAEREAHEAEAKKLADERAAFEAERAAIAAERAAIAAKAEAEIAAKKAADQADADSKALAEYHAAITAPAEEVQATEPEAPQVPTELFTEPLVLSGQLMSIAMEPTPPNAEALIGVIATHFKVSDELAAEWLDSADFTPYY